MSQFLLPYAMKVSTCTFTPPETTKALRKLADIESEDSDDEDDSNICLHPLQSFDSIKMEYLDSNTGAFHDRKQIPTTKRIEFLARMLVTVEKDLRKLGVADAINADKYMSESLALRQVTEEMVRKKTSMPYFVLPLIELKYLQAPNFGPHQFGKTKEYEVEK